MNSPIPLEPWRTDPLYIGMSEASARASWNAAQQRDAEIVPLPSGPEDYGLATTTAPGVVLVSAADWPNQAPPAVDWVVRNRIPRGDVSTLDGDGGLGKTMAALQLAGAVALSQADWLGQEVCASGRVIFLSAEEPESELHRRVYRIASARSVGMRELRGLDLWFPSDLADCLLAGQVSGGALKATPLFENIRRTIEEAKPVLVVLDNVAATFGGNQNDRGHTRTFINLWRDVARKSGAGVLLLNHPSLNGLSAGTGRGGSMDWRNAVRAALHLKPSDDRDDAARGARILECVKNNYAPLGDATRLQWTNGILTVEGSAVPYERAAADRAVDDLFLSILDEYEASGREVRPTESRTGAAAMFSGHPKAVEQRVTARAFKMAMERLLASKRLAVIQHGPPSKQVQKLVRA